MPKLSDIIAPSFYEVHKDIKQQGHTHYWLKGGRGSTKSSFASTEIILGIMKDPNANAVALRKVGMNLKDSVYEQLEWAIKMLGVEMYWQSKLSPLELIYIPTGQRIIFRGADKPKKIKSTKFRNGYCKYIWYEEVDEFGGMEEIRTINQSLMRGGESFCVFYSYNPPQSQRNWVNEEVLKQRSDRLVHHSNYLDVPRSWLGEQFFIEAEHLNKVNERAYMHEYMGEVTGTGGEVFTNIELRRITEEELKHFDRIYQGLDFGWFPDPLAFVRIYYDRAREKIYFLDELYQNMLTNELAAGILKFKGYNDTYVTCDSAEPKSIYDLRDCGINAKAAVKGKGSVEYGMKWLQKRTLVIDGVRTPSVLKEFTHYEYEKDKNDDFIDGYPDANNHLIDATRYALERVYAKRGSKG